MEGLVGLVLLLTTLSLLLALRSCAAWRSRTGGHPLPPGPPQLPLIGNLHNMPKVKPWYGLRDICNKYGDVVYFNVLGQRQVVLGSTIAIREFLDKHNANNSDRMVAPIVKITGNEWGLVFMPYGVRWRSQRRAFRQYFQQETIHRYQPVQTAVAAMFLQKLLMTPERFQKHIRFAINSTMLKICYGIDVDDENNELVTIIEDCLEGVGQAIVPGRFMVDYLPFLQYVPAWMPGTGFKTLFAKWRQASTMIKDLPFEQRNTAFTSKVIVGLPSIADAMLFKGSGGLGSAQNEEEFVKEVNASAVGAGADTMSATLQAFLLAMALYPEVQRKAQTELDATVGPKRLPDFDDRDALVYVNAVVKELLRWFNVGPVGVPHRVLKDDVIQGYFIPAGTLLVPNVWACMHDPEEYEAPDEFRPERFIRDGVLDPHVRDPYDYVFGAGRRICPGRHLADASLFLKIACVLHVFEIRLPLDERGIEIRTEPQMADGFLSYFEDCRVTIRPRSKAAEDLINASNM